jgi:hypothetical protein
VTGVESLLFRQPITLTVAPSDTPRTSAN